MFSQEIDTDKAIKMEYLFGMCHDFRTPLNIIMGMTTLAQTELENKEKIISYLSRINTTSNYLLELINDIMDFSKIYNNRLKIKKDIFDLYEMITKIKTMITPKTLEKKQNFQIECTNINDRYLVGDILRITQVLMNLLTNAVNYTAVKGDIILEVKQKYVSCDRAYLEFTVADTGIGMSKAFVERMFEPFEQEKNSLSSGRNRTGLGLYITRKLISLMGGEILVQSQPMKGTEINVKIPFRIPNCMLKNEYVNDLLSDEPICLGGTYDAIEYKYNFADKRIIVAEDNPDCLQIMQDLLTTTKIDIESANNGHEAVKLFEASEPGYYDAILMDIRMPKMNGLIASERIRDSDHCDGKNIPIIAMTANTFPEDIVSACKAGMDIHIGKPIDFNQLLQYLNEIFLKNSHEKMVI